MLTSVSFNGQCWLLYPWKCWPYCAVTQFALPGDDSLASTQIWSTFGGVGRELCHLQLVVHESKATGNVMPTDCAGLGVTGGVVQLTLPVTLLPKRSGVHFTLHCACKSRLFALRLCHNISSGKTDKSPGNF